MSEKAKLDLIGDRAFRVERTFDAPRDRVWRAMTEPALLAQWWGRGNPLTVEAHDMRVGGRWRFVEHTDHGSFGFSGTFREIHPPEHVVLTFGFDGMPGKEMINEMRLEDLGGGRTRLLATSTFESPADRDGMMQSGMEGGMNQSYAALDRVLAGMGQR
jgi:uncharacterized protein YndB with AHSA1/START domain